MVAKKLFYCEECGASFNKNSNKTRHMKIHFGIKNYKCDTCDKKFTESHRLKDHLLVHLDYPQLACNNCHHIFTYKSSMIRHARSCNSNTPRRKKLERKAVVNHKIIDYSKRNQNNELVCDTKDISVKLSTDKHDDQFIAETMISLVDVR